MERRAVRSPSPAWSAGRSVDFLKTKLTIEYDGAGFAGWARQPGERTVQEELERALQRILGPEGTDGRPLRLTVAGRTDRGVHAWGQVASYAHEAVDPRRLNGLLPPDVGVLRSEPTAQEFDARRDARSRTYCYRILARRTRSVFERERSLLVDRAARPSSCSRPAPTCSRAGTTSPPSPRRETEHSGSTAPSHGPNGATTGELLEFWIESDMFLRHMNPRARGNDARRRARAGWSSKSSRNCWRAGRARRRGRRCRPTGWRWRLSAIRHAPLARSEDRREPLPAGPPPG